MDRAILNRLILVQVKSSGVVRSIIKDKRIVSTSMKKHLTVIALGMLATTGWAQSGTNSPYSQYGLGILSDQSTGFNRGTNNVKTVVNDLNCSWLCRILADIAVSFQGFKVCMNR